MSPSSTSCLLALLSAYSIGLTLLYCARTPRPLNAICARDHVDPSTEGSCLCGARQYCLCTPSLAADILIEVEPSADDPGGLVFVVRADGRGLAMVGGFVRVGESAEDAARREAFEETGLALSSLSQFCMFSSPERDPRRHTSAMVFAAKASGRPRAADDAKATRVIPLEELRRGLPQFAFDHGQIVAEYLARAHGITVAGGMSGAAAACPSPGSLSENGTKRHALKRMGGKKVGLPR
ncbi:hypothetical protein AB1Y20_007628 [Prymnesium parvum]|uniref:Nudix hydrolase domain-containing protein n=1 Tax=Prymnesium parvum TaxID=97485 RepID=A0AB34IY48_PRYPA